MLRANIGFVISAGLVGKLTEEQEKILRRAIWGVDEQHGI